MLPGKRYIGLSGFLLGMLLCLIGPMFELFFILAVAIGCFFMMVGGIMFAKSFLDL